MLQGPTYDDNYSARKMTAYHTGPTFLPPSRSPMGGYLSSYIPPPPRMVPRMAPPPTYYDYDYGGGYGGYGGYGYPSYYSQYMPPPPQYRYRSYEPYLDDEYDYSYIPRYRPTRYADTLVELEKEKLRRSLSPSRITDTTTTKIVPHTTDYLAKHFSPGMLQDQVDKMRVKLKSLAFSLDPTGPVPEIVIPDRSRRVDSRDLQKKYSSALEFEDLPKLGTRRHHYYPEDEHMKDNLRIKCLSHYKTTQTQAEYWKPKGYYGDEVSKYSLPNYTSRYATPKTDSIKWEEPDTVYGKTTDRKPYSKTADVEDDDAKKERRKKKKSKERDDVLAIESTTASEAAASAIASESIPASSATIAAAATADPQVSSALESTPAPASELDSEMDEKERKRLEKKKRKAEREAAAKAAMEAELEALAVAELELARLEAESAGLKPTSTEAKASESARKCESPIEAPCDVLPECIPKEFESEPTFPSNEYAVDESFQDIVEELKEPEDVFQDISADKVTADEPVESELAQDESRFIAEALYEPEPTGAQTEEVPEPPYDSDKEPQVYTEEINIDDEPLYEPVIPESSSEVPENFVEPIEATEPHVDTERDDNQPIGVEDVAEKPILEEQQHQPEEEEGEEVVVAAEGAEEGAAETTTTADEAFEYVFSTDGD